MQKRLEVADGVIAGGGLLGLLLLWITQIAVVPRFARMFAEFGGVLPAATRIALSPLFAAVVSLLVLALIGLGVALRLGGRPGGRPLLAVAVLPCLLAIVFELIALYLPIFELAGAIQ